MDRRTLLAFALMALVLLLFQQLTPKAPPRPAAPPSTIATDSLAATGVRPDIPADSAVRAGLTPGRTSGVPVPAGEFRNTLVPVEARQDSLEIRTGGFVAGLQAQGARFSSWTLTEFTDAKERPANLVKDREAGLLELHLLRPGGDQNLGRTLFQVVPGTESSGERATFLARDETGASVKIEYTFPRDRYSTSMRVSIDGIPNGSKDNSLRLVFPSGMASLERDPRVDHAGAAGVALLGRRLIKHRIGRGRGGWSEEETGLVQWAGTRSKYFLIAAIPKGGPDGKVRIWRPEGEEAIATAIDLPLNLSGPTELEFEIFAGPMKYRDLESYGVGLEKAVDLGWRFLLPFSRLLLKFFQAVHTALPNYGVVILVLSILTKVIFYPLTKKSMESMKQMQLLKPELDRLNAKYKDDPQRRNQATLELYKKNKINPLGGCLPVLIQMPVFIALYNVLNTSIELRKAPFVLWIRDLSAPDRVGDILGFPIHVMPLIMAGTMFWQQKLTPTDPRQAGLAYLMPIVMTVFFYTMPSGLVFYWTVNNLMSVGQQIWMNRSTIRATETA